MLATALQLPGPASVRYPRGAGPQRGLHAPLQPLEVGRAELLREGDAVALVAIGSMVDPALAAADLLAQEGVEAAVVNARFAKPLDEELICALARRCRGLVTVEENAALGGFGAAVLELLAARGLQVPVRVLGLPDRFVAHGDRGKLLAECGLDAHGIARVAAQLVGGRYAGQAGDAQEVSS
jgi:1-deoxy-D-xylulose-5-phosphate synthase